MKLSEFLAAGGKLVNGDKYVFLDSEHYTIGEGNITADTLNDSKDAGKERTITHFEWRNNKTGKKPEYAGRIEVEFEDGIKIIDLPNVFAWGHCDGVFAENKRWRPALKQLEEKLFPQVGDKCLIEHGGDHDQSVISIHGDYAWVFSHAHNVYNTVKIKDLKPIPEKTDTEKTVEDLEQAFWPYNANKMIEAIKAGKIHCVKWEGES